MNNFVLPLMLLFITACSGTSEPEKTDFAKAEVASGKMSESKAGMGVEQAATLTVFKDPNCGCCSKWIDHLEAHNISVKAINTSDMESVKAQKNIPRAYQSCHTGISQEGYFFEGHIPAKTIARFLKEKPEGMLGLTVPAMPVGSPGMEVEDKFLPYKVFAMNAEGVMTEYASFDTYQDQF